MAVLSNASCYPPCRPLSMAQRARRTTWRARLFCYETVSAAQPLARARVFRGVGSPTLSLRRAGAIALSLALTLSLVGCVGDLPEGLLDDGGGRSTDGPRPQGDSAKQGDSKPATMGCDGDCKEFVLNQLLLPTDDAEAKRYGVELDGQRYNALGSLLVLVASMNLQGTISHAINEGNLLLLLRLDAKDLRNQANTNAQLWIAGADKCCAEGLSQAACAAEAQKTCFNGSWVFQKGAQSPDDMIFNGSIQSGQLYAGPSSVRFNLQIRKGMSFPLTLKHGFISGKTSDSGVTEGILNGALPQSEIQGSLIPEIAAALDEMIQNPHSDPNTTNMFKSLFDLNHDGTITKEEVSQSSVTSGLFAGDVDVDKDGEKELSFGIGFKAVPCEISLVSA